MILSALRRKNDVYGELKCFVIFHHGTFRFVLSLSDLPSISTTITFSLSFCEDVAPLLSKGISSDSEVISFALFSIVLTISGATTGSGEAISLFEGEISLDFESLAADNEAISLNFF